MRYLPITIEEAAYRENDVKGYKLIIVGEGPMYSEIETSMLNLEVLGSMRALMTAGPALKRENISGYN